MNEPKTKVGESKIFGWPGFAASPSRHRFGQNKITKRNRIFPQKEHRKDVFQHTAGSPCLLLLVKKIVLGSWQRQRPTDWCKTGTTSRKWETTSHTQTSPHGIVIPGSLGKEGSDLLHLVFKERLHRLRLVLKLSMDLLVLILNLGAHLVHLDSM